MTGPADAAPAAARAAAARVLAIDPARVGTAEGRLGSELMLLREYLRRASLWWAALGEPVGWPFFDAAALVAERAPHAAAALPPPLATAVEAHLDRMPSFSHTRRLLRWYVRLAAVPPEALAAAAGGAPPPPLYEPAVRFYERGGSFHLENRMFFPTGGGGGPLGRPADYLGRPPYGPADASDAALDALDAGEAAFRARG